MSAPRRPERLNRSIGAMGRKVERVRKPLAALSGPEPDPLAGVPDHDDPQEAAAAELDAVQAGFRDRAKREAERFATATDSAYYTVLCFDTGEQCGAFLAAVGVKASEGDLFVDGRKVADRLGIELPEATLKAPDLARKVDPKLARLARPLKR